MLIGAIDHGAGRVEQQDLVDRLDLPGVEHHLLAVEDPDALGLRAPRASAAHRCRRRAACRRTLCPEDVADLARRSTEQAGVRGDRAAQTDHPGVDVLRAQPRAVQPMVLRRRPEVPDVRLAAAGQQRVAGHLVAGPLPDVCARDVPDVVEVEEQDSPEVRRRERCACPPEPVLRSRSTFQRSSQSTFIEPGDANRMAIGWLPPCRSGCVGGRRWMVPAVCAGPSSPDAHYDAHDCRATPPIPVALHETRTTGGDRASRGSRRLVLRRPADARFRRRHRASPGAF